MKKVKVLVVSLLFCAVGYTGYSAHEKMTTSEAERFMNVNVEALTRGEGSGGTTCESKITAGDRKTFFCGPCDWVSKSQPSWDSLTTFCP